MSTWADERVRAAVNAAKSALLGHPFLHYDDDSVATAGRWLRGIITDPAAQPRRSSTTCQVRRQVREGETTKNESSVIQLIIVRLSTHKKWKSCRAGAHGRCGGGGKTSRAPPPPGGGGSGRKMSNFRWLFLFQHFV